MSIESLYDSAAYNDTLALFARKNLLNFDEYKQEVFSHLVEYPSLEPRKAADKIAKRMKRKNMREYAASIEDFSDVLDDVHDYSSILWEDRHVIQ